MNNKESKNNKGEICKYILFFIFGLAVCGFSIAGVIFIFCEKSNETNYGNILIYLIIMVSVVLCFLMTHLGLKKEEKDPFAEKAQEYLEKKLNS